MEPIWSLERTRALCERSTCSLKPAQVVSGSGSTRRRLPDLRRSSSCWVSPHFADKTMQGAVCNKSSLAVPRRYPHHQVSKLIIAWRTRIHAEMFKNRGTAERGDLPALKTWESCPHTLVLNIWVLSAIRTKKRWLCWERGLMLTLVQFFRST